ncbi:MAG: hypothetical protein Q8N76_04210, partial [Candidatus Omnitrophota bacterium]|nr:hypothetical protein [Candidatus Omnitrophota bacterium]
MKKISIIVLIVFILSNAAYGGVTKSDFRSLKFLTSEVEGSSLRPEMVFGKGRMRKEPVLGPEVMYQGVLHEVIAQSEEMIGGQLRQKVKLRPIAVNDSAMEFTIIGPSVSKLAPMDISAIDLKVLKQDVRKAIAVLKKEKQKPTMSVVSLMIGHSEKYLIYLLEQEKLMPEQLISWGIYRQEIVLWILEQNVRSAVVRLEER